MSQKSRTPPEADPDYNHAATCHVCGSDYMARFNVGGRARVCTPPSHRCVSETKNGRRVACSQKCCKSQWERGASAQFLDGAIDPRKVLTDAEFKIMLKETKSLRPIIGSAIRFIAATGCRLREALLLRREDVDVMDGMLSIVRIPTLKRAGRPKRRVDLRNKSAAMRELAQICSKLQPQEVIFKAAPRTIQAKLEVILDKIKPDRASLVHLLRHTHASQLIARGADWNYVRARLGWSSLEMAKVYAHTDTGRVNEVLGDMPE